MAIVLPGRQQQPSNTQRFIDAFSTGLDAVSTHMKEKQKKEKMQSAANKLQIDPAILDLPEDAQKAYFQQKFAAGPKPLNALQEAQRDAALAKQGYYQQEQKYFDNIMRGQEQQGSQDFKNQVMQEPQQDESTFGKGIMKPGADFPENPQAKPNTQGKGNPQKKIDMKDASTWPDSMIKKFKPLKGKSGIRGLYGNMADDESNIRQNVQNLDQKKFEADRTYHSKISDEVVAEADEILKKAPIRKGLINQQRRDIASGETSGILPFMAEKTGLEMWRSPEAARFKTASKQRFIENLSSIGGGARPNQFIEQQLVGAQAALGRDPEANQTVLDMEEFIDDLEFQRAKYIRDLSKEDRDKYGYVRNDVGERASEKMESFAEQRQDEMAYDIRKRREANMSDQELTQEIVGKRVTPDTPLTLRAARILMIKNNDNEKKAQAEAKRLGYRIPTEKTYLRGQ